MTPSAILFDWDNTLADNWGSIHAALNATLRAFGQPVWTLDEAKGRVRESLRDSFPRLFGDRWEAAREYFYARFREGHLDGLGLRPDAEAALAACADASIPIAIVSNKTGGLLRAEVAHLGWAARFGAILGAGDSARDKPDPQPAFDALERLKTPVSSNVWFVGDTEVDVDCALAAGLTAILLPGTPNVPARPQARSMPGLGALAAAIRASRGIDTPSGAFN